MTDVADLQVINDDGIFQIDNLNYCISVVAQGTLASATESSEPWLGATTYTITYSGGDQPIFALYMSDSACAAYLLQTTYSSGVWTVVWVIERDIGASGAFDPSAAHWFVLDRPRTVSGTNYGCEIFDASGNLKFSTNFNTRDPLQFGDWETGRKYALVGGSLLGLGYIADAEEITLGVWVYSLRYKLTGFYSDDTYGPQISTIDWYYESGSGTGGGSGDINHLVSQPLYAFDVTDLI